MARLAAARVARLATSSVDGVVHLVPVCFALMPGRVVSVVDQKPKTSLKLRRLQDMRETGRAVLLVDHYDDDWSQLWWIRVTGAATVHEPGDPVDAAARTALTAKYEQYRALSPPGPVWSIALDELRWWAASDTSTAEPDTL
jgi:PPOX class probable F420-dependent enzyme